MSAGRKPKGTFVSKNGNPALNDMLDFGPDVPEKSSAPVSSDVTMRIKNIIKQMQEISRRIDDLAEKL